MASRRLATVLALLALLTVLPVGPVAAAAPTVDAPAAAPADRLLVGLRADDPAAGLAVPHRAAGRLFGDGAWAARPLGGATYQVDLPAGVDAAVVAALAADRRVRFVEPEVELTLQATPDLAALAVAPDDPAWAQQEESRRIEADRAWEITTGRPEIVIAVLDTGAATGHPDLAGKLLPGVNFLTGKANAADDQGHGTLTASVAAGLGGNKKGMAGVCWGCRLLPLKILDKDGRGDGGSFIAAIRYAADNGARVINVSAGGPGRSQAMEEAVEYAVGKGAIVIASAGNTPTNVPNYPAAFEQALAVSATSPADGPTSFSTFGPFVDLAAPGVNITGADRASKSGGVMRVSGTSFSAPLVSGLAGLALSLNPELSVAQLTALLTDTAVDLGAPGRDDAFGAGRLAAYDTLLAVQRPGPAGGASLQAALGESPGQFRLTGAGFAPGERLRAWLAAPDGRVLVARGLAADGAGALAATVSAPSAAGLRADRLTVVGEQSKAVAVAPISFAPPAAVHFQALPPSVASPDRDYYADTGHTLTGGFRFFWAANGGVDIFGYPISEEFSESGRTVQYFERARFEYHPDLRGTRYETQLGLLGSALTGDRIFPTAPVVPETPTRRYFAATRHTLAGGFLAFWEANGGTDIFGQPISEEFTEEGRTVQYFERARFEYHPEQQSSRYEVQIGPLGRSLARRLGYTP